MKVNTELFQGVNMGAILQVDRRDREMYILRLTCSIMPSVLQELSLYGKKVVICIIIRVR